MTVKNPSRFYRVGASMLVQVPVGRGANLGLRADENWEACSSVFNDPGQATGDLTDRLVDTFNAPHLDTRAMLFIQPLWQANTGDSTADLQTKIHAALNGAGYRTVGGAIIS